MRTYHGERGVPAGRGQLAETALSGGQTKGQQADGSRHLWRVFPAPSSHFEFRMPSHILFPRLALQHLSVRLEGYVKMPTVLLTKPRKPHRF